MDFLGKEGEKAAEAVQNLSRRVEDLESHLNAVDSALQDLRGESREMDLEIAQENRDRLKDVEQLMVKMADIQEENLREVESEEGKKVQLEDRVDSLEKRMQRTRKRQMEAQERMDALETKLFDVEDELTQEVELNQSRIESRVTESTFEEELKKLRKQISRMKTSVNALADDLDDDSVRVE